MECNIPFKTGPKIAYILEYFYFTLWVSNDPGEIQSPPSFLDNNPSIAKILLFPGRVISCMKKDQAEMQELVNHFMFLTLDTSHSFLFPIAGNILD